MRLLARVVFQVSPEMLEWEVTTLQRLASLAVELETFSSKWQMDREKQKIGFWNYDRILL